MIPPATHIQERAAEKQEAVAMLNEALCIFERETREPDQWERFHLKHALDLLIAGAYGAIAPEAAYALEPPARRHAKPLQLANGTLDRFCLAILRRELAAAAAMSVTPHPPPYPYLRT